MFFRTKHSGIRSYLQIVENVWKEGRTQQNVIATLGRLDRLQASGDLDTLIQSAARFSRLPNPTFDSIADSTYISVPQASRILGVTRAQVVSWILEGKLVATTTPGKQRRVKAGDIRKLMPSNSLAAEAELSTTNMSVFVVDDDPLVLKSLKRSFARLNGPYEVEGCQDGIEALVRIGMLQPDLVLLDTYMEAIDGAAVCKRLQNMRHLVPLRVVAITAYPESEAKAKMMDAGAAAFWVKPVSVQRIIKVLELPPEAKVKDTD